LLVLNARKNYLKYKKWVENQKDQCIGQGPTAAHPQVSSPSGTISMAHHTCSLDIPIALQGSWMLIERDLQVHRPFGQTESTMVIERFLLRQSTQLIVTSYSLQYIMIF